MIGKKNLSSQAFEEIVQQLLAMVKDAVIKKQHMGKILHN